MAVNIVIPEVGESVTEGVIASWTKADGDRVERDETVLELETDKITMEIPAPAAGVVRHSAAEGDTVQVGAVVGEIDESASGGSSDGGDARAESTAAAGGSSDNSATATATKTELSTGSDDGTVSGSGENGGDPVDVVIPEVGESVTEGVIAAWSKADGEAVKRDDTLLELETDKVTMEVPAPADGVLRHKASEGDTVAVGAVVAAIEPGAASADSGATSSAPESSRNGQSEQQPVQKPVQNTSQSSRAGDSNATPLARKLATDHGVDLGRLRGTGTGGRIREQDVLAAVQANGSATPAEEDEKPVASPASSRATSIERMSPMRQRIASRLVEAQQTAAMLTTFNEVDMGPVMDLRKKHKEAFGEKHGINLGFMSFFVKACCGALQKFPKINSYIVAGDDGKPAIETHDYCDVAIAVSSPKGLVVPVLRNAEAMSFAGIESGIKDFAIRAKEGKLGLEEMTGGTFTITNGGIFGSLMSTPILNPPQSAILGMHTIKNRSAENINKPGEIALRPMMYLALSYDHRIVDGAEAVQFLVYIKDAIEDPARLMLDL